MGLYNERGNMRVTVDDTSMPFGIYAADGSLRVTVVDGSTFTGLYDADGGFNVVTVDATDTPVSIYHPCGALRGVSASSETGLSAPNGALYMDGLQSTITAPVLDWDDETADTTPDFTCTLVDPVVGDTLTLQLYSDAGLTTLVDSDVNVLDAGEVTAEECTFSLAALSDGTYYARVFAERTGWSSSYSNTVTVTISSAWSPLDLGADLLAWYDASDSGSLTLSGSDVTQWDDLSGNSMHLTQGTSGRYPQYSATSFNSSYPGLTFSDDFLEKTSFTLVNNRTVTAVVVGQMNSGSPGWSRMLTYADFPGGVDDGGTGNGAFIARYVSSDQVVAYKHPNIEGSKAITPGAPARIMSVFDGTNHTMYVDNSAGTPQAVTDDFTSGRILRVGVRIPGDGTYWNGIVSEVFLFKGTAPDSTLRATIDDYLTTKWGL